MTLDEAKERVLEYLHKDWAPGVPCPYQLVVCAEHTIIRPYGWIFFYNTKEFAETGNIIYALGGNGPVVFEKLTGQITSLGTARPTDVEVAAFEAQHGLPADGAD